MSGQTATVLRALCNSAKLGLKNRKHNPLRSAQLQDVAPILQRSVTYQTLLRRPRCANFDAIRNPYVKLLKSLKRQSPTIDMSVKRQHVVADAFSILWQRLPSTIWSCISCNSHHLLLLSTIAAPRLRSTCEKRQQNSNPRFRHRSKHN